MADDQALLKIKVEQENNLAGLAAAITNLKSELSATGGDASKLSAVEAALKGIEREARGSAAALKSVNLNTSGVGKVSENIKQAERELASLKRIHAAIRAEQAKAQVAAFAKDVSGFVVPKKGTMRISDANMQSLVGNVVKTVSEKTGIDQGRVIDHARTFLLRSGSSLGGSKAQLESTLTGRLERELRQMQSVRATSAAGKTRSTYAETMDKLSNPDSIVARAKAQADRDAALAAATYQTNFSAALSALGPNSNLSTQRQMVANLRAPSATRADLLRRLQVQKALAAAAQTAAATPISERYLMRSGLNNAFGLGGKDAVGSQQGALAGSQVSRELMARGFLKSDPFAEITGKSDYKNKSNITDYANAVRDFVGQVTKQWNTLPDEIKTRLTPYINGLRTKAAFKNSAFEFAGEYTTKMREGTDKYLNSAQYGRLDPQSPTYKEDLLESQRKRAQGSEAGILRNYLKLNAPQPPKVEEYTPPKNATLAWINVKASMDRVKETSVGMVQAGNHAFTSMAISFARVAYGIRTISYEMGVFKALFMGTIGAATNIAKGFAKSVLEVSEVQKKAKITLEGSFGDPKLVDKILKFSREYAITSQATFGEVTQMAKSYSFIPQIKRLILDKKGNDKELEATLKEMAYVTTGLASTKPEQGVEGAIFSIREALAGQFRSLKMRFEIPMNAVAATVGLTESQLKERPEMIMKAMKNFLDINVGEETLRKLSMTFQIQMNNIGDVLEKAKVMIGQSGFEDVMTNMAHGISKAFEDMLNMDIFTTKLKAISGTLSNFARKMLGYGLDIATASVVPGGENKENYAGVTDKAQTRANELLKSGDLGSVEDAQTYIRVQTLLAYATDRLNKAYGILLTTLDQMVPELSRFIVSFLESDQAIVDLARNLVSLSKIVFSVATSLIKAAMGMLNFINSLTLLTDGQKSLLIFFVAFPVATMNIVINSLNILKTAIVALADAKMISSIVEFKSAIKMLMVDLVGLAKAGTVGKAVSDMIFKQAVVFGAQGVTDSNSIDKAFKASQAAKEKLEASTSSPVGKVVKGLEVALGFVAAKIGALYTWFVSSGFGTAMIGYAKAAGALIMEGIGAVLTSWATWAVALVVGIGALSEYITGADAGFTTLLKAVWNISVDIGKVAALLASLAGSAFVSVLWLIITAIGKVVEVIKVSILSILVALSNIATYIKSYLPGDKLGSYRNKMNAEDDYKIAQENLKNNTNPLLQRGFENKVLQTRSNLVAARVGDLDQNLTYDEQMSQMGTWIDSLLGLTTPVVEETKGNLKGLGSSAQELAASFAEAKAKMNPTSAAIAAADLQTTKVTTEFSASPIGARLNELVDTAGKAYENDAAAKYNDAVNNLKVLDEGIKQYGFKLREAEIDRIAADSNKSPALKAAEMAMAGSGPAIAASEAKAKELFPYESTKAGLKRIMDDLAKEGSMENILKKSLENSRKMDLEAAGKVAEAKMIGIKEASDKEYEDAGKLLKEAEYKKSVLEEQLATNTKKIFDKTTDDKLRKELVIIGQKTEKELAAQLGIIRDVTAAKEAAERGIANKTRQLQLDNLDYLKKVGLTPEKTPDLFTDKNIDKLGALQDFLKAHSAYADNWQKAQDRFLKENKATQQEMIMSNAAVHEQYVGMLTALNLGSEAFLANNKAKIDAAATAMMAETQSTVEKFAAGVIAALNGLQINISISATINQAMTMINEATQGAAGQALSTFKKLGMGLGRVLTAGVVPNIAALNARQQVAETSARNTAGQIPTFKGDKGGGGGKEKKDKLGERTRMLKEIADSEFVADALRKTAFQGYSEIDMKKKLEEIAKMKKDGILTEIEANAYLGAVKAEQHRKELDFMRKMESEHAKSMTQYLAAYKEGESNFMLIKESGDEENKKRLMVIDLLEQYKEIDSTLSKSLVSIKNMTPELLMQYGLTEKEAIAAAKRGSEIQKANLLLKLKMENATGFEKGILSLPGNKEIMDKAGQDLASALSSGLSEALLAVFDGDKSTSFRDAMKKLGDTLKKTLIKALTDTLVNNLIKGLFGMGQDKFTGKEGVKELVGGLSGDADKTSNSMLGIVSANQTAGISLGSLTQAAYAATYALQSIAANSGGGGGGLLGGLFDSMGDMNSVTGSIAGTMSGGVGGGVITDSLNTLSGRLGLSPAKFAKGGIVSKPTLSLMGEAGTEGIAPLKNGRMPVELSDKDKESTKQQPTQMNIVNVIDPAMVDKAIMNDPNTVINVISADIAGRGRIYQMMKGR